MSEPTRESLMRTIEQAREDIETWPEWMREAARMSAAIPPGALSVSDEVDRLRAENEKLLAEIVDPTWDKDADEMTIDELRNTVGDLRCAIVRRGFVETALRDLADSEGTRAVECLRRARKAESLLQEVLEALPGLQAPNCLGMDLYQRIGAAVGPNADIQRAR